MSENTNDPTEPMRMKASLYPSVDEGTACTQSSFKANKQGFLYIGKQGGRYKAMFKLKKSIIEADDLAAQTPADFQVGNTGWVTARFTAEEPMPTQLWEKWLDESYELCFAKKSKGKK
ncbi:MAG: hypothetical protein AB8G95_10420 [Anaerolineae bacterium]